MISGTIQKIFFMQTTFRLPHLLDAKPMLQITITTQF